MIPSTSAAPTILVDLLNLVFRVHFTHKNLESDGRPSGVLHGVPATIYDLRSEVSPRIVFCWDHGVPVPGAQRPRNWREDFVPAYKATRKRDEGEYDRIVGQLPLLSRLISWLGYDQAAVPGMEADDLIGILANEIPGPILIFSSDKDLYQLVNSRVRILSPKKIRGKYEVLNSKIIEDEYETPIAKWAEFLALGGDQNDNIKPRKGMGPKTAARLVAAGVTPSRPFNKQPIGFQAQYRDLEPIWKRVQDCYTAARIPTQRSDPRLKGCGALQQLRVTPQQHWPGDTTRRRNADLYARFCADWDLVTLFSLQRNLFHLDSSAAAQR